jgi:hypothetical protein
MTHTELQSKLDKVQKTHLDFIEWALSNYGVKVSSGVILRHLGKYPNETPRKISEGFQIAYGAFFDSFTIL